MGSLCHRPPGRSGCRFFLPPSPRPFDSTPAHEDGTGDRARRPHRSLYGTIRCNGEANGRGTPEATMSDQPEPITIRCRENGPLVVHGPFRLVDHTGKEYELPTDKPLVALCRCGHSGNKPFCDGSHKGCGFTG
jgi:hypothetical protein